MSRVTHSSHALLSFVSSPVSSYLLLGSHFSVLFVFVRDLCPRPSALAAADFSGRFWHESIPQFLLTITLLTSFSSTIVLLLATA